uniref:Uncharacterized protein n=1 Tax=Culex tarsalis TaxID=7177 RepID=A0A1Q3EWY7_CULTA
MKRTRWDAFDGTPEAKVPKRSEKLKPYEVPEPVRMLCASNYCHSDDWTPEVDALLAELELIKGGSVPLSPANYRDRLRLLNHIEDEHLNGLLRECQLIAPGSVPDAEEGTDGGVCYRLRLSEEVENSPPEIRRDTEVRLTVHQKNCLHVEHSDERCQQPRNVFSGTVDSTSWRFVRIRLDLKLPEESTVEKVEFIAERAVFRLEYRALELLKDSFVEKVLFPREVLGKEQEQFTSFEWFQPSVASNREQAEAIRSIVNETSYPAPYLLFGPPGTGKTATLVEAIGQICKLKPSAKILAMATSNAAANELTVRLLRILPEQRILRFFAKSLEKKKDFIDQRVMNVSNLFETPHASTGIASKILSFQVVVCTLSTAGRLVMFGLPRGHFSHIFIDECGSAKEISCLVPIASFGTGKDEATTTSIVLAGDPKQLGPVIQCDFLDQTNHGMSLLERLTDHELYRRNDHTGSYDPRVITLLRDNFRSHLALLKFPNQAFYDGQLRVKADPELTNWAIGWRRLPNYSFPLIFHSVAGEVTRDKGSASMANVQEAKRVASYVEDILWNGINGKKIAQNSIGIISPYACQVRFLKELLKSRGRNDIEVGSTEQYQGREKAIMIISTVRSGGNGVGFLANSKRLNVSVTRAQALMIVVGDADTLEKNENWKEFIGFCRKHRAIVGSKK